MQVGYSLNALVDFSPSDPISIIKHLLVGSEGTLAFITNVTYKCVPDAPFSVRAVCRLRCHCWV
jgi:D-lactate dehydrogenase